MLKPTFKLLLTLLALLFSGRFPLRAGDAAKASKPDEAALEKQLHDAQKQLREAARQLAQLHRHDAELHRNTAELARQDADAAADEAGREIRIVKRGGPGKMIVTDDDEAAGGEGRKKIRIMKKFAPRARLGVRVETSEDKKGAVIRSVETGSPAETAGLKAGDIITGVNGAALAGTGDDDDSPAEKLADLGREFKADMPVTLDYLRDGASHTATIKPKLLAGGEERRVIIRRGGDGDEEQEIELPEMPDMPEMPEVPKMHHWGHPGFMMMRGNMDGLELMNLQGDLGDYFGVHEGLLVLRVSPKSELPLKAGDVILKVDGKAVSGPHDVMHALHHGKAGDSIALEIQRHQLRQSLTVKRPARSMDRDTDFNFDYELPEPPETPEAPEAPLTPRAPKAPKAPHPPVTPS